MFLLKRHCLFLLTLSFIFAQSSMAWFYDDQDDFRVRSYPSQDSSYQKDRNSFGTNDTCLEKFKQHKQKDAKKICSKYRYNSKDIQNTPWDKYFSCIEKGSQYVVNDTRLKTQCVQSYYNYWYRSKDIDECFYKVRKLDDSELSHHVCLEPTSGKITINYSFDNCISNFKKSSIFKYERVQTCSQNKGLLKSLCFKKASKFISEKLAFSKCEDYNISNQVNSHNFSQCMSSFKKKKANLDDSFKICTRSHSYEINKCVDKYSPQFGLESSMSICNKSREVLSKITSKRFSQCFRRSAELGVNTELGYAICLDKKAAKKINDSNFLKCAEKGIKSGIMNYFKLKNEEFERQKTQKKSSAFYYLFKDCNNNKVTHVKYNPYLKVYRDYNMHANARFKREDVLLGGLSALRFDQESSQLLLLSDDRGHRSPPRIYVYDYKFDQNGEILLKENKTIKLRKKRNKNRGPIAMDPEGFDILDNGEIIIASEMDDVGGKDFLTQYNSKGVQVGTISINEVFRPIKTEEKECRHSNGFLGLGAGEKCYIYSTEKGLKSNKSFESLSLSPDKKTLFIGNEQSLFQDTLYKKGSFGKRYVDPTRVRIVKYSSISERFVEDSQYFYRLDNTVDNGLVEILAIDEDSFLTLERSWNNEKKKLTAKIFYANLHRETNIKGLNKKQLERVQDINKVLIMDLDDIIPALSPGFRLLDNFEGMAFGPTLPNGKQSLVLVTDNNFRLKQRTNLLFLELDLNKLKNDMK